MISVDFWEFPGDILTSPVEFAVISFW